MSNPFEELGKLSYQPGIRIIASEDIPNGYRRIDGTDVFISPGNYRLIKELDAKGILVALAHLTDVGQPRNPLLSRPMNPKLDIVIRGG